ncbi:DMT family transporter [Gorillibacterium timonense]|uniref:DMT family transporter n=1 Tax=Gorillibacterium timonense TaxID=1689269 RepID=UPI00071E1504|nr:DMT family transporter [Gorillibacterium timonense]
MKGIIYALLGGAFITLQGVANTTIGKDIGTWQAATLTQLTGFLAALLILMIVRDGNRQGIKQVKPLYRISGAFAAVIIFNEVTAIETIGATVAIAVLLIAQLGLTFLIDKNGWFEVVKQNMKLPQFIGLGLMITGIVVLNL